MKIEPTFESRSSGTPPALTQSQFTKLVAAGKIVDGRAGGLLFGRSCHEGGILALFKLGSSYVVKGRLEGGEFVVNWSAATKNIHRLQMMNLGRIKGPSEPGVPDLSELIVTHANPDDRMVYLHWGQSVINREATSANIVELVEMNHASNPYVKCDLRRIFNLDRSKDGVI